MVPDPQSETPPDPQSETPPDPQAQTPPDPQSETPPDSHSEPGGGAPLAALANALETVGDRWSLLVIAALLEGPKRFGELQEELPGIAPNILTQRLRQLERDAVLVARPYSERPPRFEYELTSAGQELAGVLRLLAGWGARDVGGEVRHSVCGTPLEARWWCPTCEQPVADDDEELHFA